jgi:dTDP-4-dehydrorhamnose 3,5-epimerase-like enzyme
MATEVHAAEKFCFAARHYNPADELRIAYNDPAIAYDWEAQHK